MNDTLRVGQGFDVHRFISGRRLVLGGVEIDFNRGLEGHSDADVLCHSVSDALLGAAAMGDIGELFPSTDIRYKDADSLQLLGKVVELISDRGYRVINVDTILVCESPNISEYRQQMRQNLARVLRVRIDSVSIKATTTEKLGFTGRSEGIAVFATALIERL